MGLSKEFAKAARMNRQKALRHAKINGTAPAPAPRKKKKGVNSGNDSAGSLTETETGGGS